MSPPETHMPPYDIDARYVYTYAYVRQRMLFKQLAPIMKMDLALLSPAKRWMVLMYGTPILKAPRKLLRFVNVGRDMTP